MAGYDEQRGKSNNAVDAERENRFPASTLAKKLGVSTEAIRKTLESSEWHHTSGWYNETNYYDGDLLIRLAQGEPVDDVSDLEVARAQEELARVRSYRKPKDEEVVHENCTVKWPEWSGPKKWRKSKECQEDGCRVVVKGKSATVYFPDGRTMTKRLNCTGFDFGKTCSVVLHDQETPPIPELRSRRPHLEPLEARNLLSGPGSLDTTFGTDGLATAGFTTGGDQANAVAVQIDGKLIAAGQANGGASFAAARFNADGSLDTSYGTEGEVTTPLTGATAASAVAVTLQSDGAAILAGSQRRTVVTGRRKNQVTSNYWGFALVRYTTGGALDPTFGSGGTVVTPFGATGTGYARAVAVQTDGKIVAAGLANTAGQYNFTLVRYNTNGSLDTGFGSGGKVTTPFATPSRIVGMAIQGDGKIVAAGYTEPSYNSESGHVLTVARYNTDGSLDPTFGSGGVVSLPNPAGTSTQRDTRAMALQSDGKIVVVARWSTDGQFDLVRFNPDGTLDPTFGTGGEVLTTFPATNDQRYPSDVTVQTDDKIVVGGYASGTITDGSWATIAVRYNPDGSLDTGFGNGGIAAAATYNKGYGVAIQPSSGRIVVAGRNNGYGGLIALTGFVGGETTPSPRRRRPRREAR
jgi:uncharacterized delta-60 repeat protein